MVKMNIVPELYDKSNSLQRQDATYIIEQLSRDHGERKIKKLLDVGCGTGNITKDIVDSVDVDSSVGIDLSESMVKYANDTYSNDKIEFRMADICDDWEKLSQIAGIQSDEVDIVTSSYCLHWVSDQEKAMRNIFRMLKPGGSCYITMFSWSQILPLQEQITFHPRWGEIFRMHLAINPCETPVVKSLDAEGSIPIKARRKSSAPFPVFEIPSASERTKQWSDLCENVGLVPEKVEIHDSTFTYNDIASFKGELKSLCHYLVYIPEDQRAQFMEDYFEHMHNCYISRQDHLPKVKVDYQYLTVVARKPENLSLLL